MLIQVLLNLISMAAVAPLHASGEEAVTWQHSTRAALEQAARADRLVLVYVSSSTCGYCREMERRTLSHPLVGRILREHFVPLAVDGNREPKLVESLRITGFPTIVAVSARGEVVARMTGFVPPQEFASRLAKIVADRQEQADAEAAQGQQHKEQSASYQD